MCETHLVQRSAQVVHALLTLSTQLHVPPQEGETLKTHMYVEEAQSKACNSKAKRDYTQRPYLQHQCMSFGYILLRSHVEEGETHAQAVERVFGVSLEGLNILA